VAMKDNTNVWRSSIGLRRAAWGLAFALVLLWPWLDSMLTQTCPVAAWAYGVMAGGLLIFIAVTGLRRMEWPRRPLSRVTFVFLVLFVLPTVGGGGIAFLLIAVEGKMNAAKNMENKPRLAEIMRELSPGDTKDDVQRTFDRMQTATLKLHVISSACWNITMPFELGASDWILWIDFLDDKVTRLRIRLSDSARIRPPGAPEDKKLKAIPDR